MSKRILPLNDARLLIDKQRKEAKEFFDAFFALGVEERAEALTGLEMMIAARDAEHALSFSQMLPIPDTELYFITDKHSLVTFSDN